MNNKTLVIGWIIFSLFILALITRNGDIAWMMLPFLAYLLAGVLQTPTLDKLQLIADRSVVQTRSNGNSSIEMSLSVQNQAAETVHLSIWESVQEGMKITDGELSRLVTLRPGETAELKYAFTAQRGDFSWDSVQTVAGDPLGLIETGLLLPANVRLQVRPPIKKFKAIPFRPHNTIHSPGSIPARLGGSGTDFYGIREYHPGDLLRSLDWRLTARHPRKFFTKEFEQEEIAEIGLILDARQSTDLQIGEQSLFEHSLAATGSLAEMFLHQGHRVSLLVFGRRMSHVFPGYGKVQLHRILSCLSRANIETEISASAHLDFIPIRVFPSHAMVIIITPLTASDKPLFQRLRAYGYQAMLVCPDTLDFATPTLAQDLNNQMAIRATRLERRLLLNEIAKMQIPVIDWKVSEPLYPMLRSALSRSRGQREHNGRP